MSHRVLSDQFFVSHEQLGRIPSGEFDTPLTNTFKELEYDYSEGNGRDEEVEHGGVRGYIDHLKDDIARNGIKEPLKLRMMPDPQGNQRLHLVDGHHRAAAALEMKLPRIPMVRLMT